ncbi:MAG TPA: inositol monophosphatase family protein [Bryobacteraceae bacterium]|nr:inositol monophosphatase family protein [Bryobacteraceae bacterium]
MSSWFHELEVASDAARQAAELALRYQPGITAETKPDDSPVTQADREGELLIARILNDAFPADGLLGEEGTRAESRSGRRWIIDPIDGTRDYVRGNPLWANLIALEDHGEVVAGVVHLPLLGSLYTAARGAGAFRNGAKIRASQKTALEESVLCFNGFNKIESAPFRGPWLDWMARCWAMRGLGGAPDAMMVASGQADIWMEPSASPWDFAPLKIILEEAGARYFNLDGGASIYAGNCVACAPGLEQAVRRLLSLSN